ncbi:MAG: RNA recognition motif domain-containing protein [Atribacterota bacterium]
MIIYVGNLSKKIDDNDLKQTFEKYGKVVYSNAIKDDETNEPLGFGFVGMVEDDDARNAIEKLNQTELDGKIINVRKAHIRTGERRKEKDRRKNDIGVDNERRSGIDRRSGTDRRKRRNLIL